MRVWLSLLTFTLTLTHVPSGAAYELPKSNGGVASPDLQPLQAYSRGMAALSKLAGPAVVFLSVSKPVAAPPFSETDPFDYFHGQRPGPQRRELPPQIQQGVGSGFFVDLDKGYIVTNNHVIAGADEIEVKLANGETNRGKVVGRDPNTDIAVVRLEKFNRPGLRALVFADSDQTQVGDLAVALGAPFGLEASVSQGVVSAVGRGSLGIAKLGDFLQTDAAINPGNSGGPIVNASGEVIGVSTAIFSTSGSYSGIGFAVPSNMARLVANRLITDGKMTRGYLGASLQALDPGLTESLKLPAGTLGALVASVSPASPAAQAGMQAGDVVAKVNGKDVKSVARLVNEVGLLAPGTSVKLRVLREGKARDVAVQLGDWPRGAAVAAAGDGGPSASPPGPYGLVMEPLTPAAKQQLGSESDQGAVVVGVRSGSPAERAGLQEGDVILSVNGQKVASPSDVQKQARAGGKLLVRIERQGNYFFVTLNPQGLSH